LDAYPNIRMLFTDVGLPRGMNGRQLAAAALRLRPDLHILSQPGMPATLSSIMGGSIPVSI
jgi:hypothetical protein